MAGLRRLVQRLAASFRSRRAETDLTREIASHLRLLEDQFIAEGMSEEAARYAARRAFGGVEQVKEQQRDTRSFRWLTGWPMDLKLGVRMLARTPGLTAIAVTTLAVAIGAGAAYHEFMLDLMYPTLREPGADRIIGIRVWDPERRAAQQRVLQDFVLWRDRAGAIDEIGAASVFEPHLITSDGRTDTARGVAISASAFRLFPVAPLLGRTLVDDDEQASAEAVVVIGHDLWVSRFDSDTGVIGRTVRLGSAVHTVVGVMPEGFAFPIYHNLWTPLKALPARVQRGEGPIIHMFGRLSEGVSAEGARAELQGLLGASRADGAALRVDVRPYLDSLLSEDRDGLEGRIFYAANLVFVMLLAVFGANVATLVFARTATRDAEISIRTALGAGRGRICAQLFAEALVLSAVGALAGLAVARFVGRWGKQTWIEMTSKPRPFWWDDRFSPETVFYTAVLAIFAALIVGVIPALKATGRQLQGRLRGGSAAAFGTKLGGVWTGLIVTQVALTLMFLATMTSLGWAVLRSQYGFGVTYPRDQFLTARVPPDALHAIVDRLKSEPNVAGVTYATAIPGTIHESFHFEVAGPKTAADRQFATGVASSETTRVGPDFFEAFGVQLVSGRHFTPAEIQDGHPVAVVDEEWVRSIAGGRNPLGMIVRQPPGELRATPGPWHEIIGVVRDVTVARLGKRTDNGMLYRPAAPEAGLPIRLLIRTKGSASLLSQRLQAAALSVAPDVRLSDVMSIEQLAREQALSTWFFFRVVTGGAAIALLLSTAGIYALMSFSLTRRTREIGIRAALGAAPRRIITGVFSRAFMQIALGVLAGAVPSVMLLRLGVVFQSGLSFLAGVTATVILGGFVICVALVSCVVPLRRALRIEPTEALRVDG